MTCATRDGKNVQLQVCFDVVEGKLPVLAGQPSLKAMTGIFSFNHDSLSIIISRVHYRIQLLNRNFHFYVPLKCKSTFSRPLIEGSNVMYAAPRSIQLHQPGDGTHYFVTKMPMSEPLSHSIAESRHQNKQRSACPERSSKHSRQNRRFKIRRTKKEAVVHNHARRAISSITRSASKSNVKSKSPALLRVRPARSVRPAAPIAHMFVATRNTDRTPFPFRPEQPVRSTKMWETIYVPTIPAGFVTGRNGETTRSLKVPTGADIKVVSDDEAA